MNIRKDILWRTYFAFFMICVFAVVVIVYAFNIGVIEREKWQKMAEEQTTDYQTIQAIRGNIYADDGSLLATSVPIYDLRMDFRAGGLTEDVFQANIDSLAYLFAVTFKDKGKSEYLRQFKQARREKERYFLLKRRLNYKQVKVMRTWPLLRLGQHKGGLMIIEHDSRQRPFQSLAQRTIGYKVEGVAPVGLEGAFDKVLAGVSGERLMQKISGGRWIPVNDENEIEPENGKDIYTTIDVNIQDVAEDALNQALVTHDAMNGCAVLMEVQTGHIKAIANLTRKSEGVYAEEYNYAVGESAEPGSTVKLASMIALLENGASLEDSVDVDFGETRFFDRVMKDSEPGNFKRLTLKQSFEKSSNVGISKLVYKHFKDNPEKFVEYFEKMGMAEPMNLQITGEGKSKIKHSTDNDWYGTTLPWMSIGYEARFTPLKILMLYNAVANGGKMVRPIMVTEVRHTGKLINKYETEVVREKICSKEVLEKVKQALEGVVTNGTAKNLLNVNYKVAGKTGTAQMASGGGYNKSFYKSSFVGYFPADNPKYACIVSINGPSKGVFYGAVVAGPVFKEIADKVYASSLYMHKDIQYTNVPPEMQTPGNLAGYLTEIQAILNTLGVSNSLDATEETVEWVQTSRLEKNMRLHERRIIPELMPNVVGMTLKDALFLLENRGIRVVTEGKGRVSRQSFSPGTKIYKGSTIVLTLK